MISLFMFALFLIFLFFRMPVSISMGLSALMSFIISGEDLLSFPQMVAMGVNSYPLMAVPFFILAGTVMNYTGLTTRIFNFCKHIVGHLPGGLAQVNVLASMIFAGISGAAVADCAGLGTIQIKAMTDAGYRKPFSASVTIASACIGPIIPPSLVLVIYAIQSNTSVASLFLGGVIPGILMGIIIMLYIAYLVKTGKETCPQTKRATFFEILKALKGSFFAVISPIIILWALVGGIVTPTEAGVIATIYAVFVGVLYGDFKLTYLPKILEDSLILTALIMFIIAMATAMGHILTLEQTPLKISNYLLSLTQNRYILLLLINVFLLFLGSILEGLPALIIMVPILLPLIQAINMDLVHFGVMMCFNITLGIITPPMAIGIFILVGVTGCSFEEIAKSSIRFLIPLIISLLLIAFIPSITLFLPNLLMGK